MSVETRKIVLVYDGECPVCSRYALWARVRETQGEIELVDAREAGELTEEIGRRGFDLDRGMVLKVGDAYHHGAEAIHVLSLLGSRSGIRGWLHYRIFRSRRLSRVLYPVLWTSRNLLLRLLGRKRIGAD